MLAPAPCCGASTSAEPLQAGAVAAQGGYCRWSRSAPARFPSARPVPLSDHPASVCPRACTACNPACLCLLCIALAACRATLCHGCQRRQARPQQAHTCLACPACTCLALCGVLHPFWWPCPWAPTQTVSLDAIPQRTWVTIGCVGGVGGGGLMLRDRCDMIQHAQPKAHRCCTLASISSADLPEAQMMKMCPNLAS